MSTTSDEPQIDIRGEVDRVKRLLGLDVNRLTIGAEIEGIITPITSTGFGSEDDYTVQGLNYIEIVNVSSNVVAGAQTGS